jgi:uncharacterized protein (UPF0332 family)
MQEKFLNLAKRMISSSSIPEEDCRSAISRAYYSLYHNALKTAITKYSLDLIRNIERVEKRPLTRSERNKLNALNPEFLKSYNFHRILPKMFLSINERPLSNMFMDFREKRNKADYDLKLDFNHSDATTIVSSIESLINQVKSL